METVAELITIKTLHSFNTAELYKVRLDAEDIECFSFNANPELPIPSEGIRLEVKPQDLEKAQAIINSLDQDFI